MDLKRYVGKWWLPTAADRPVGGVLEVGASSELRLELTDTLLAESSSDEPTPIIYGAASGREITLLDSMPANGGQTTVAQVITTTQVVRPEVALVGIRLENPRQEVFRGLETRMTGLAAWADRTGFEHGLFVPPPTDSNDRARLTIKWTDPVETELDETPETVGLHWSFKLNGPKVTESHRRYLATEEVALQVTAKAVPQAWDGFLERVGAVRDLVTVATQSPSRVLEHHLLMDSDGPSHYRVGVYFEGIDRSDSDADVRMPKPLFRLSDVDFGTVIHDWLQLRKTLGLPLDVLLGLDYQRGGAYPNRLFNAASAAEGFHTALFPDSTALPPEVHESVKRRVAPALYYAEKSQRDWASSRINDNRPGLKDRLLELVTRADGEAVQTLLTNVDQWATWLKNVRNAIGHLNTGELESKVPEGARFRLTYVTRALLHLILLAELGLSGEVQRRVVAENWAYSAERFGEVVAAYAPPVSGP